MLLLRVMPLSFCIFPLSPLPLYFDIICPSFHSFGISVRCAYLLIYFQYMFSVSNVACMNISLGISSGPVAFFFWRCFLAFIISSILISFGAVFTVYSIISLTLSSIFIVHSVYSSLPFLA